MDTSDTPGKPGRSSPDRGELARRKLIAAAIEVFGKFGFDGTTTRAVAAEAGVNQQAIPYYFGGKEGLYMAVADHIATAVGMRMATPREAVQARLARLPDGGESITPSEARALLVTILAPLADLLVSDESAAWARFMIREQMAPTEAFSRLYARVMGPVLEMVRTLVGIALDEAPASERVRLRSASLVGGVLVFRVAHAAAMRFLEWKTVGPEERRAIRAHVADLVASVRNGNQP